MGERRRVVGAGGEGFGWREGQDVAVFVPGRRTVDVRTACIGEGDGGVVIFAIEEELDVASIVEIRCAIGGGVL